MLKAGLFVMAEVDLREDPWAEAGRVIEVADIPGSDVQLALVKWADRSEPVWETGWTLRQVSGHGHSPIHDREVSIRDQQRIDAAELNRL